MRLTRTVRGRLVRDLPLAAVLLALAGAADASMMSFLSIEDLSRASTQVVRARILSQTVRWTPAHDGIYTEIEAQVIGQIVPQPRGPAGPRRITIVQAGGEIDGVSLDWTGRPRFQDGEDLILFLQAYDPADPADNRLLVVGGKQGRMRVIEDAHGRAPARVERDLLGVMEAPFIEGAEPTGPGHRRDVMQLEDLSQRAVRAHGPGASQGANR